VITKDQFWFVCKVARCFGDRHRENFFRSLEHRLRPIAKPTDTDVAEAVKHAIKASRT
jgi:hypothetical protein